MDNLIELQKKLSCLTEDRQDEVLSFIYSIGLSEIENIRMIARQVFKFTSLRLKESDLYVDIIKLLCINEEYGAIFQREIENYIISRFNYDYINKADLLIIRKLIKKEVMHFSTFIPYLEKVNSDDFKLIYPDMILFFLTFIDESEKYKYKHLFLQFQEKFSNLISFPDMGHQMSGYDEFSCDYGAPQLSLWYSIKYDDLDHFQYLSSEPGFDFRQKLPFNPFDPDYINIALPEPINLAAFFGSINVFKFILNNISSFPTGLGESAVSGGNLEIVRICEQKKLINLNCLQIACSYFRFDILNWLIDNIPSKLDIDTLMETSSWCGNLVSAKICLEKPNLKYKGYYQRAAKKGNYDFVKYLYQFKKEINETMRDGNPALFYAAKDNDMIDLLLSLPNIQISKCNKDNESFLHILVQVSNHEYLEKFMNHQDLNCNAQTKVGETPLHWAAHKRDPVSIGILLKNEKVDPNIQAKNGKTAFDIVKKNNLTNLMEMFTSCPRFEHDAANI